MAGGSGGAGVGVRDPVDSAKPQVIRSHTGTGLLCELKRGPFDAVLTRTASAVQAGGHHSIGWREGHGAMTCVRTGDARSAFGRARNKPRLAGSGAPTPCGGMAATVGGDVRLDTDRVGDDDGRTDADVATRDHGGGMLAVGEQPNDNHERQPAAAASGVSLEQVDA